MNHATNSSQPSNGAGHPSDSLVRSRPAVLHGHTIDSVCGCGTLTVTVNLDETGAPFEVFLKDTKAAPCTQSLLDTLAVAMSLALRAGTSAPDFVEHFRSHPCAHREDKRSYADAIAIALDCLPAPTLFNT